MIDKALENLSEAEAALYDRQIRLWGLDSQKRLRAANVLIAGLGGLSAEVTKNIILAGVNSITLLDHKDVTEFDTYANFLAPSTSIGQNIAEASKERAQILNPMVKVKVDTENIVDKPDVYFEQFDIVCITRVPRIQLIRINNICREKKIQFYAGDVNGMIGFMFCDLQQHFYVEEIKEKKTVKDGKDTVEESRSKKRDESFISLADALQVDWTLQKNCSRLRRTTPSYFIMLCLWEFLEIHGRAPHPDTKEQDIVELLTIKNSLLDKIGVAQEKVPNTFAEHIYGEVSPVCAIVGGVIAQEMIKAVSKKDPPIKNFFFFNAVDNNGGIVENFGSF